MHIESIIYVLYMKRWKIDDGNFPNIGVEEVLKFKEVEEDECHGNECSLYGYPLMCSYPLIIGWNSSGVSIVTQTSSETSFEGLKNNKLSNLFQFPRELFLSHSWRIAVIGHVYNALSCVGKVYIRWVDVPSNAKFLTEIVLICY